MPSRTPASRPRATMSAVHQQSRMRLVASADLLYGVAASDMTKAQASKTTEAQGCNRRDSDAGRCGSPACATQPVHDTANVRGLDRAACCASNTGLDGSWHCLPSMLSVRGAAEAGRAEAAASAAEAHASGKQERTLHCAPYPIAAARPTVHQGTKPQKEHA